MNEPILIVGDAGTGKTFGIRTLDPKDTLIINCAGKRFPFKHSFVPAKIEGTKITGNVILLEKISRIRRFFEFLLENLAENLYTTIIVDDFQIAMIEEVLSQKKNQSWDKWIDLADEVKKTISAINRLPEQIIVFLLTHSDTIIDQNGIRKIKAKTVGKMIDNNFALEGLTTIVLGTEIIREDNKTEYSLLTQSDGIRVLRSPYELFPERIPNDFNLIKTKIYEFYNL